MVLNSVDLPAPERPITPMKPPGATENDALSTAAFVPKRHVKPSTTSMHRSRGLAEIIATRRIEQLCDSRAAVRHPSTLLTDRHGYVTPPSSRTSMTCNLVTSTGTLTWPTRRFRTPPALIPARPCGTRLSAPTPKSVRERR